MVWIKCKTGQFLDPSKIRSIDVYPSHGRPGEVEIFADYQGEKFLLHRTSLESLQKIGIRHNQEKFQAVLAEIGRKRDETNCLSYEDIFRMILEDGGPACPEGAETEAGPEP